MKNRSRTIRVAAVAAASTLALGLTACTAGGRAAATSRSPGGTTAPTTR